MFVNYLLIAILCFVFVPCLSDDSDLPYEIRVNVELKSEYSIGTILQGDLLLTHSNKNLPLRYEKSALKPDPPLDTIYDAAFNSTADPPHIDLWIIESGQISAIWNKTPIDLWDEDANGDLPDGGTAVTFNQHKYGMEPFEFKVDETDRRYFLVEDVHPMHFYNGMSLVTMDGKLIGIGCSYQEETKPIRFHKVSKQILPLPKSH